MIYSKKKKGGLHLPHSTPNPPATKFLPQDDAHLRADVQIKFLYYPLVSRDRITISRSNYYLEIEYSICRIFDLEIVFRSADRIFDLEIVIRSADRTFVLKIELPSADQLFNLEILIRSADRIFDLEILIPSADRIFDFEIV